MLILMCTSVFPEYILCTTHVPGASAGQRGFWISWTGIIDVLNHSVGVGNWTQVFWESSNAFTCKAISPSLRIITLTDIYFLYYLRQNVTTLPQTFCSWLKTAPWQWESTLPCFSETERGSALVLCSSYS